MAKMPPKPKKNVSLEPMESCHWLHLGLAQAMPLFQDGGKFPITPAFGLRLQLKTQSSDWACLEHRNGAEQVNSYVRRATALDEWQK
jgi:hypothetical protein